MTDRSYPLVAPVWLTAAELAARWRLSLRTIDRWRAERYGPAWHAIGGRILYRLDDVEAFEARQRKNDG